MFCLHVLHQVNAFPSASFVGSPATLNIFGLHSVRVFVLLLLIIIFLISKLTSPLTIRHTYNETNPWDDKSFLHRWAPNYWWSFSYGLYLRCRCEYGSPKKLLVAFLNCVSKADIAVCVFQCDYWIYISLHDPKKHRSSREKRLIPFAFNEFPFFFFIHQKSARVGI